MGEAGKKKCTLIGCLLFSADFFHRSQLLQLVKSNGTAIFLSISARVLSKNEYFRASSRRSWVDSAFQKIKWQYRAWQMP